MRKQIDCQPVRESYYQTWIQTPQRSHPRLTAWHRSPKSKQVKEIPFIGFNQVEQGSK